jgi:signal transduction histidine kinase
MRPAGGADELTRLYHTLRDADTHDASASVEVYRLRKDESLCALWVTASRLDDAAEHPEALAAICRDVTDAKRRDEELRQRNEELLARDEQMRALTARLNAIREAERTRISREVHDELGQLLTGIKMDLRWMYRRAAPDGTNPMPHIAAKLKDAEQLVDTTIESVQRLALELRPSALDALGLAAAVRDEARRFEQRAGIRTEARVSADLRPGDAVATSVFRVLQELLTNVARHAQASVVSIDLFADGSQLVLRVQDDGIGVEPGTLGRPTALGLVGVSERAHEHGGDFQLEGSPGTGTVATVRVPIPKET